MKKGRYRKYQRVVTDNLCDFGCSKRARWKSPGGKYCCESHHTKCSNSRKKNSDGLKRVYEEGRRVGWDHLTNEQRTWNKGLTKDTDERVKRNGENVSKSHQKRIKESVDLKEQTQYYKTQCSWKFGNDPDIISRIKGYELLKEKGMYSKKHNPEGVVRDHRFSVHEGFTNNIDPMIVSHPANCEFITQKDNARKTRQSSILLEELFDEIKEWKKK